MEPSSRQGRQIKPSQEMKSLVRSNQRGYRSKNERGYKPINSLTTVNSDDLFSHKVPVTAVPRHDLMSLHERNRNRVNAGSKARSPIDIIQNHISLRTNGSLKRAGGSSFAESAKKLKTRDDNHHGEIGTFESNGKIQPDSIDNNLVDPMPMSIRSDEEKSSKPYRPPSFMSFRNSSGSKNQEAAFAKVPPNGSLVKKFEFRLAGIRIGSYVSGSCKFLASWPTADGHTALVINLNGIVSPDRYKVSQAEIENLKLCSQMGMLMLTLKKPRTVPNHPNNKHQSHIFYTFQLDNDQDQFDEFLSWLKKNDTNVLHIGEPSMKIYIKEAKEDGKKDDTAKGKLVDPTSGDAFYGSLHTDRRLSSLNRRPNLSQSVFKNPASDMPLGPPMSSPSRDIKHSQPGSISVDSNKSRYFEHDSHSVNDKGGLSVELSQDEAEAVSRRPKRKAVVNNLERQQKQEELNRLVAANRERNIKLFGEDFAYTFRYDNKSVDITVEDFARLSDYEYLNDTMINFFLKYAIDQLHESKDGLGVNLADQIYVFNTYFFAKLSESKTGYENVKRWTSKIDIFKYKYIVVPVHSKMHWYVAIIYNLPQLLKNQRKKDKSNAEAKEKEAAAGAKEMAATLDPLASLSDDDVQEVDRPSESLMDVDDDDDISLLKAANYMESSGRKTRNSGGFFGTVNRRATPHKPSRPPLEDPEEGTCIYVLDSLKSSNSHTIPHRILKDYIVAEAKERKGIDIDRELIYGFNPPCPQQDNYCDCGVFVVHYVETFLRNPELFAQLAMFRKKKLSDENKERVDRMWREKELPDKRKRLRQLILSLKGVRVSEDDLRADDALTEAASGMTRLQLDEVSMISLPTIEKSPVTERGATPSDKTNESDVKLRNANHDEPKAPVENKRNNSETASDSEDEDFMIIESKVVETKPKGKEYRTLPGSKSERSGSRKHGYRPPNS